MQVIIVAVTIRVIKGEIFRREGEKRCVCGGGGEGGQQIKGRKMKNHWEINKNLSGKMSQTH